MDRLARAGALDRPSRAARDAGMIYQGSAAGAELREASSASQFANSGFPCDIERGRDDPAIKRLARVEDIIVESEVPRGSAQIVIGEATACLPLGGLIDVAAERARLEKAIGKNDGDIAKLEGKLANERFLANAKPEIVASEREKLDEAIRERDSLSAALQRLSQIG